MTSIGEKAFYKNTSLKNIVIGSNVEKIDAKAFYGCTSLNSIVINSTSWHLERLELMHSKR